MKTYDFTTAEDTAVFKALYHRLNDLKESLLNGSFAGIEDIFARDGLDCLSAMSKMYPQYDQLEPLKAVFVQHLKKEKTNAEV